MILVPRLISPWTSSVSFHRQKPWPTGKPSQSFKNIYMEYTHWSPSVLHINLQIHVFVELTCLLFAGAAIYVHRLHIYIYIYIHRKIRKIKNYVFNAMYLVPCIPKVSKGTFLGVCCRSSLPSGR